MVNKDFIKQVLVDKKKLIPRSQLRPIVVPNYDELSVKNLWADAKDDPELNVFFPNHDKDKKLPPREYFFNVLNTIQPEYLDQIIRHAQNQREERKGDDQLAEKIEITEEWKAKLL